MHKANYATTSQVVGLSPASAAPAAVDASAAAPALAAVDAALASADAVFKIWERILSLLLLGNEDGFPTEISIF